MSDVRGKTVRMDDDLWTALAELHDRTGASEAELIRRGVVLLLAFDAAQRGEGPTLTAILESLGRKR